MRLSERMRILWSGTKVPRRGTKIPRRRTKVPRRGTKVPRKEQKYSGEEQKYREIPRRGTKRMETIWTPYYGVLYGRIVQRWIRLVILRELFLLSCVHLFLS